MFFKKIFCNIHRKTTGLGSLFNNWGLFFQKDTSTQVFSVDIAKFLRTAFFVKHLRRLLLTVLQSTVKSVAMPALWFRASMCFQFWSKTYAKRCTNATLLSRDKTIFLLLELIDQMFLISERFGKTFVAFDFDEKHTQCIVLQK